MGLPDQHLAAVTILCGKGCHPLGGGTRTRQVQREQPRLGSTTKESLMLIKKAFLAPAALAVTLACTAIATPGLVAQEKTVMVGGAAMFPSKDIIDNAVNSKDHTTLVAAVKAAGLVETLKGRVRSPCSRRPTRRSPRCRPAPSTRCSSRRTRRRSPRS